MKGKHLTLKMNMKEDQLLIAYCGLNCRECEAFKATERRDFDALRELAQRWGEHDKTAYRPMDLECEGCKSNRLNEYCDRCSVRECGVFHGFESCAECEEYPCDKLSREWETWHDADWPSAKVILDNMKENKHRTRSNES
jgi:hypothetical protein